MPAAPPPPPSAAIVPAAIVPALNEEETIASVVTGLRRAGLTTIIVVDNGSVDDTARRAIQSGAIVIFEAQKGYGRACLTGMRHLPGETQWVLFCDADGSDDLRQLPELMAATQGHDLVLGNRRATREGRQNLTPVQNFGNWLSGLLLKIGWGKGFSDLGPLRLIRRSALEQLEMRDESFGWTVEMQAKALEHGLRYCEVPVRYHPRQGGISKISGNLQASVQAGKLILTTIGRLWLRRQMVQRGALLLCLVFLLGGALILREGGDPADPENGVLLTVGVMGLALGGLCGMVREKWAWWTLCLAAVGSRLLLLGMPPGDDIWRYLWEGMVQHVGYNPYNLAPDAPALEGLRTSWWPLINNQEYTALYPPMVQLIFRGLTAWGTSVLLLKSVFLCADLLTGWLLWKRFGRGAALYLFNPLVLYCFAGAGHYDSLFLLPLVAGWLLWEQGERGGEGKRGRLGLIGLCIGVSASLKLVSLLAAAFLAATLARDLLKKQVPLSETIKRGALLLGGLSLPIVSSVLLFCLLSGVPSTWVPGGFTEIARTTSFLPWLSEFFNEGDFPWPNDRFLSPLLVCLLFVVLRQTRFAPYMVGAMGALLLCSPMVHAWYVTWLIPFAVKEQRVGLTAFSLTAFLYFLQPFRYASGGEWGLTILERLLFWSPLLVLMVHAVVLAGWKARGRTFP